MDCTLPLGLALAGSSSLIGSDKSDKIMFKCRLPEGKVIFAESAEYDKETNQVIINGDTDIYWFIFPEDEFDCQMNNVCKNGYCDFKEHILENTEEKIEHLKLSLKKRLPTRIKKQKIVNIIFCCFLFLLIGIFVAGIFYIVLG